MTARHQEVFRRTSVIADSLITGVFICGKCVDLYDPRTSRTKLSRRSSPRPAGGSAEAPQRCSPPQTPTDEEEDINRRRRRPQQTKKKTSTDEEEDPNRRLRRRLIVAPTSQVIMNVCREWEIFIPEEAVVQSMPLQSLPLSVLKRMRLPLPDWDPSRRPTDLPTVTWICPAFLCKKGLTSAPPIRSVWAEGVRTLKQCGSRAAPLKMSFKSSNRVAFEVLELKDVSDKCHTRPLPQGTVPTTNQTALVIFRGQIYLCIRKSELGQKQQRSSSSSPSSAGSPEAENVTESSCQTKASPGEVWSPLKESCVALRRERVSPDAFSVKRIRTEQASPEGGAVQETLGGKASSSSSGYEDAIYKELEEEEEIAQLKARWQRDEDALNSLLSGT